MPWFPIPFVLNEHGKLKTEDYRYTEVTWRDGVPSSLVSRSVTTVNTFSMGKGNDFGTTTPPPNKSIPGGVFMDMNAGACSEIAFTVRPRLHLLEYTEGKKKVYGYRIRYVLKVRKNPKAEKNTFRVRACTKSIHIRPYYYYLRTSPFGSPGYWGGDASIYDNSVSDKMLDLTFGIHGSVVNDNNGIVKKIKEHERGRDITHGVLEEASVVEWDYRDLGPIYDRYHGLTREDACTEYEITFPNNDSSLFFELDAYMCAPCVGLSLGKTMYERQDIASTGYVYLTIELENEDDVIYGDGFSSIYLGENNIEPGMMFKGEVEPTEIYIGENLVWSN